jgi:hypothetical protein
MERILIFLHRRGGTAGDRDYLPEPDNPAEIKESLSG